MSRFDVLIRNGTVVDGTGRDRFVGDVGISGGNVAAVGQLGDAPAAKVIDAKGLVVAPGYIDPHTHYDAQIFWDPYCTNSGWHGVTTVVTGNCGFGFAPCRAEDRDRYMSIMESTEQIPKEAMRTALPWTWETFPEWVTAVQATPMGVNLGKYVPLNSLMIWVMGYEAAKSRPATEDERIEMRRVFHEAMDAGAMGFAFSYLQEANSHKDTDGSPMPTDSMHIDETYNLARAMRERGQGLIQAFVDMPNCDGHRGIAEDLARIAGQPVLHNITAAFDAAPSFHQDELRWLEKVHSEGLPIYSQALAFRYWQELRHIENTFWSVEPLFHELEFAGDIDTRVAKALDPDYRRRFREWYDPNDLTSPVIPLEGLVMTNAKGSSRYTKYELSTFGEIAEAEGLAVTDAFLDLAAETRLEFEYQTGAVTSYDPDYTEEILRNPVVIPGTSDGGAHVRTQSMGHYGTEMITWMVRETGRFALEEMHQKLSQTPAHALGLHDRGEITAGQAADVVIYDYDELGFNSERYELAHDLPGGEWRRLCRATGYRHILINGEVTFNDNECTGATPGMLVSPQRQTAATR